MEKQRYHDETSFRFHWAKYLVFLQPTIGLKGQDISSMSPGEAELFKRQSLDQDYIQKLNDTYAEIRLECQTLSFCLDISELFTYSGKDLYSESRHPNAQGNKIIAEREFKEIVMRGF